MRQKKSQVESTVARFIDNNDGTITDTKSGLIWVKNPHTDLPDKFKEEMTWKNSIQSCKELDFAGKKDWRLPTVEELHELVDYTRGKGSEPAIDTKFFPDTKTLWYWTATPCVWSAGYAWSVDFSYGSVYTSGEGSNGYVRPVRSSKQLGFLTVF